MGQQKRHARKDKMRSKTKEVVARSPLHHEGNRIRKLLDEDEFSEWAWEHMVLEPFGDVISRVPLILGNGIWDEDLFAYKMYGTAVANTVGFTCALLCQDSWSTGTSSDQYVAISGGTSGLPLFWTVNAYAPNTSPAVGATVAGGIEAEVLYSGTTAGGASPNSQTHYLQSASAIRVRPISTADNTSGTFMVAYTKDIVQCPLTGVTYWDVKAYPSDIVTYVEYACPNWKSKEWLTIPSVPVEREAYESVIPGAVQLTLRQPTVGFFAIGCVDGQQFEVEAISIYQFEVAASDRVEETRPEHLDNAPTQGTRAVMTGDEMHKALFQTAQVASPKVGSANMALAHPRNVNTQKSLSLVAKRRPSVGQRIKHALASAGRYAIRNVDKLLLGAAKFIPFI